MDEILAKLLQSELLSEETKAEISQQWTASVESFKTQVREDVTREVQAELISTWNTERDELITKVDTFVAEALTKEITELKGDIERFRDLEAEYATKLVEEKHKLAEEVAKELDGLVDKIDQFFEMRLESEMAELKEDLEIVKQNDLGRQMFEAFVSTYSKHYVDEKSVQNKLVVAEGKLADAEKQLSALEDERNKMIREAKMDQVLSQLTGKKREQMAMVLKNVDTARLEESYKFFIGRIIQEEKPATAAAALTEAAAQEQTTVVTGNAPAAVVQASTAVSSTLTEMKRLAGIK
jgi:hypothetical protein